MFAVASNFPRPRLSVVTPSYNCARFLGEMLDSVSSLPVSHEHIVIDGGSTDKTIELLRQRQDPSLTWISEPDRGQTYAVNKGLKRVTGDFIGWLNADDAYIPENLVRGLELLAHDQSVDAIFGFMDVVDERGQIAKHYKPGVFSWTRYLYFGDYLPTPTIVFRRSLLERAPRLDERYADAADYDFYLRLLQGARVRRVRKTLVRFRYHAASKTASDPRTQRNEGLEIRLGYARSSADRWLMRAIHRAMQMRNALISPWPQLPQKR